MATVGASSSMQFDDTIGPFLIGTLLALFLQGITMYQSVLFWVSCRKSREPWSYMAMVAIIDVLDILHSIFAVNTVYTWCVDNFGNPSIIALSPWSFTAEPVMTGITATIVHLFYAHRIILVSEGHPLGRIAALAICALTVVQLGFGGAVTGKILAFDRQFVRFASWLWGACVWLGTAAFVDVIIVVAYGHFLNVISANMATPFERSTKTVVKVATIVLLTNGLSASVAIIATVVFGVFSKANWHAIPQLCLAKLLTLSLLVCLNARTLLADMLDVPFHSHLRRNPIGMQAHVGGGGMGAALGERSHPGTTGLGGGKSLRAPNSTQSGDELQVSPAGVYPVTIVRGTDDAFSSRSREGSLGEKDGTFADQIEHGTYSRQPFVRSTTDPSIHNTNSDHPYANAV
ncbi:hypothetical protein JCM8547_002180 [Rhodosporidiobolus lusitaniae]